ncbi:TPA: hypothetical protein ACNJ5F_004258 [Yersinia enterocolitica]
MNKSLNILARIREEISDIFGFYFTSGVICLKIDPLALLQIVGGDKLIIPFC